MAHSTDNYVSGGGIMYIAPWDGSTPPEELDYVDVGNCVSFTAEPKVIKKPHKSHRAAAETTDLKVKVREECMLKFALDELALENLRMFFQGVLDGTAIQVLEGGEETYAVKFIEDLANGTARQVKFWKVEISAAGALEFINHGDGEGDWAKLEFEGECLDDSINHPTEKWGRIDVVPTT